MSGRTVDHDLSEQVRSSILALSILIDRVGTLPKADRDDLFELLQEWRRAENDEDRRSIRRALDEILAQTPITARPLRAEPAPAARPHPDAPGGAQPQSGPQPAAPVTLTAVNPQPATAPPTVLPTPDARPEPDAPGGPQPAPAAPAPPPVGK